MIAPFKAGGNWILASGVHVIPDTAISGSRSASGRPQRHGFRVCWSGTEWVRDAFDAMKFQSEQEAKVYCASHQGKLEQELRTSAGL